MFFEIKSTAKLVSIKRDEEILKIFCSLIQTFSSSSDEDSPISSFIKSPIEVLVDSSISLFFLIFSLRRLFSSDFSKALTERFINLSFCLLK